MFSDLFTEKDATNLRTNLTQTLTQDVQAAVKQHLVAKTPGPLSTAWEVTATVTGGAVSLSCSHPDPDVINIANIGSNNAHLSGQASELSKRTQKAGVAATGVLTGVDAVVGLAVYGAVSKNKIGGR